MKKAIIFPKTLSSIDKEMLRNYFLEIYYIKMQNLEKTFDIDFFKLYCLFLIQSECTQKNLKCIVNYLLYKLSNNKEEFKKYYIFGLDNYEVVVHMATIAVENYYYDLNKIALFTNTFKGLEYKCIGDIIENFSLEILEIISVNIDNGIYSLKKPITQILNKLYDYINMCNPICVYCFEKKVLGMKLEEIGNELKVTRERIRQRVKKVNDFLASKIQVSIFEVLKCLKTLANNNYFITFDILEENYGKKITNTFRYLFRKNDFQPIIYDGDFDFICFDYTFYDVNDKINQLFEEYSEVISQEKYEALFLFVQKKYFNDDEEGCKIIFAHYFNKYNNYYIKAKKLTYVKKTAIIVEKYFTNGIYPYSPAELINFREYYFREFKEDIFISDRLIQANILRNCVLIDRGKYNSPKKVNDIPTALYEEIYQYILTFDHPISYSFIYEHFEKKLRQYKINNRYYLQGLMKNKYSKQLLLAKDYVYNDTSLKIEEDILNICDTFKGNFTVNDIINLRPSYSSALINSVLKNTNKVYKVDFKTLRKTTDLKISDAEKNDMKIDVMTYLNHEHIIFMKSFYSYLVHKQRKYLETCEIKTRRCMYSILSYLFPNDFQFNYPYISSIDVNMEFEIEKYLSNHVMENQNDDI